MNVFRADSVMSKIETTTGRGLLFLYEPLPPAILSQIIDETMKVNDQRIGDSSRIFCCS